MSASTGSSLLKKAKARLMKRNSSKVHKKAHKAQAIVLSILCLFVATVRGQQTDPVKLFEQIGSLIQNNRLPEAERELTSILRVTPDLPVALDFMGTIRAKQGRLNEAEVLFVRAVTKDKNYTGARMNLAHLYLLKRAPDKEIGR